jgi:hypothetical protein
MTNNFDLKKFLIENKMTQLSEGPSAQQVIDMIKDAKFNDLNKMPNDEKLSKEVNDLLNKPEHKDAKEKLMKLAKGLNEGALKNTLLAGILALSGLGAVNTAKAQTTDSEQSVQSNSSETNDLKEFYENLVSYSPQDLIDAAKNDKSLFKQWVEGYVYLN